jgi:hypothetical protein
MGPGSPPAGRDGAARAARLPCLGVTRGARLVQLVRPVVVLLGVLIRAGARSSSPGEHHRDHGLSARAGDWVGGQAMRPAHPATYVR